MKAILKSISNDDYDLASYYPENDKLFSLNLLLRIGSSAIDDSADNFNLFICSPEWLCKHLWEPELMRHTLLVRQYNFEEIKKVITDYIDTCEGENWEEIALKLSRMFFWEFEDYQDLN